MSGAAFLLAVNFFIAQCFCLSFLAVSVRSRNRIAARWLAAAFSVASLSAICELLVAILPFTRVWAILAFASLLAGLLLLRVGIGRLYGTSTSLAVLALLFVAFVALDCAIYDLPRGAFPHAILYQLPFAVAVAWSMDAVRRAEKRHGVDRALVVMLALTSLHFIAKAFLAVLAGAGGTASGYIASRFALFSQSTTAVMVVALGLALLWVLVLDVLAQERRNAEIDPLSGLLNRRGFDSRADMLLAQPGSHSLVLCDLDNFKSVNDRYGHQAGDQVIRAFSTRLREAAPEGALAARIGGEEFALILPQTEQAAAALFAQALRASHALASICGLPVEARVSASFGVAAISRGEPLHFAMARCDEALYAAKNAGRNCVREAGGPAVVEILRRA